MLGRPRARWFAVAPCLLGALACGGSTTRHGGSQGSGGAAEPSDVELAGRDTGGDAGRGSSPPMKAGAGGSASGTGGAAGAPVLELCEPLTPGAAPLVSVFGKSDFGNPGWHCSFFVSGCKELIDAELGCSLAATCPPEGLSTVERFAIGGMAGQRYKVKFRFSGVVEPKHYVGGTADVAPSPANELAGNWQTFYRDGEPVESDQNVWKLTVSDQAGLELRHYYLNAFPLEVPYAEHAYSVQFEKSIVVVGMGTVSHTVHSPKCRAANNCGAHAPEDGCGGARSMSAPDHTATLPGMYRDAEDGVIKATPLLASALLGASVDQAWRSQVGKLTVLSVETTEDPVTIDYP